MTIIKRILLAAFLLMPLIAGCNNNSAQNPRKREPESLYSSYTSDDETEADVEVPAADSAQIYTYEVISAVSEDMPEYRYVATGNAKGTGEWSTGFITGLEVYDDNHALLLSVDFTDEKSGRPGNDLYFNMMDTMGLHVTDVNFDGYKDVIILNGFGGAHSNSWYDCWLWDTAAASFVYSQSFANICNPAIDRNKQCIYSSGGSGAGGSSYSILRFIDDEFVVTDHLSWYHQRILLPEGEAWEGERYEASGYCFREEQLINGSLETTHQEFYPNEDIDFLIDTYYDQDPWQLNSPRWYMLGGHHADEWLE